MFLSLKPGYRFRRGHGSLYLLGCHGVVTHEGSVPDDYGHDAFLREDQQACEGKRKTLKGLNFSKGTIKSLRVVKDLLASFQNVMGRVYDFDDINYDFRTRFIDYLYNEKKYNINTVAKCLNTLITIIAAAETEGYHNNRQCLGRQFKARRKDVDNIYLTKGNLWL